MCLSVDTPARGTINWTDNDKQKATRGHNRSFYAHWSRSLKILVWWHPDLRSRRPKGLVISVMCVWVSEWFLTKHRMQNEDEWLCSCRMWIKRLDNNQWCSKHVFFIYLFFLPHGFLGLVFSHWASICLFVSEQVVLFLPQCNSTVNISGVLGIFIFLYSSRWPSSAEYSHRSLYQILVSSEGLYHAITSNLAAAKIDWTSLETSWYLVIINSCTSPALSQLYPWFMCLGESPKFSLMLLLWKCSPVHMHHSLMHLQKVEVDLAVEFIHYNALSGNCDVSFGLFDSVQDA